MSTRGVCIFGVNNARVAYSQLAVMASAFVRKNMPGTKTCLITDEQSKLYQGGQGSNATGFHFDFVRTLPDKPDQFENKRRYKDTQYYHFDEAFRNESRVSVYDLSPFDETLLIDCDFLVANDVLSHVWGNAEEVMINQQAMGLMQNPLRGEEFRLNPFGIRMYWATVIYFKKGEKAKTLFDLVEHIKDNWDFYKLTYDFPGHLFRNDYAFSIAIHLLNGFTEGSDYVTSLPEDTIITALDTDQFYGISSPTDFHFFAQDMKEYNWRYFGVKTKGLNIHCMNKLSLLNNMNEIMETLT